MIVRPELTLCGCRDVKIHEITSKPTSQSHLQPHIKTIYTSRLRHQCPSLPNSLPLTFFGVVNVETEERHVAGIGTHGGGSALDDALAKLSVSRTGHVARTEPAKLQLGGGVVPVEAAGVPHLAADDVGGGVAEAGGADGEPAARGAQHLQLTLSRLHSGNGPSQSHWERGRNGWRRAFNCFVGV